MRRNLPLRDKLSRWLPEQGTQSGGMAVSPALSEYLGHLQDAGATALADASLLRQIWQQAPRGSLTQANENTIELLARLFDFMFREPHIPGDIKKLIGRLQLPLLKTALDDQDFFFLEDHPARRLVELAAQSGLAWDQARGRDDPLYRMIEDVVGRVQREHRPQPALFDNAASELAAWLAQEEQAGAAALSQAIDAALRQERIAHARQLAMGDVALRLETGEVAGFIEIFLETHWSRVLGLGHRLREARPEVLYNALEAMDDLIWSVKPKSGPDERKELLARLPSLLAMLEAWLNVVKWDGPERAAFFSELAERHASLARASVELSPRQQLEITMDVAQKASERSLDRQTQAQHEQAADEFVRLVDRLDPGLWIEFLRNSGVKVKYRLAWVSPERSRFVFAGRPGQEPITLTFDQVAQSFRHARATIVTADAVLERAMAAVLEQICA
jgi:hypothetical protein